MSYVWDCENNDDTTYAYDVGLECELSQSRREMDVQEVVQSYLQDGYRRAPVLSDRAEKEAIFNSHYGVEGCTFLFDDRGLSVEYRYSDVVVCPVPLMEPVVSAPSAQTDAVQGTIAAVTAATVSNVTSNIGTRFSSPGAGGTSISVAGVPVASGATTTTFPVTPSLGNRLDSVGDAPWRSRRQNVSGSELLRSSSFEFALGAADDGNSPDVGGYVTVWGRGDFQLFESGGGQKSGYDGGLAAGYVGAEFTTGGNWLLGMAVSRIAAKADYTLGEGGGNGELETDLTSLNPYVRFAVDDRTEAWVILGLGRGEVREPSREDAQSAQTTSRSDLSMQMMAVGARYLLNTGTGIDLALLGDGSLADVETDEGVEAVDGISASVWRARVGAEASYTTAWEDGTSLTSFLEIAARQDGGDGTKGMGLEVSPGLALSDPENGFSIQARGRALALHSADNHKEYGASITVSKVSSANGLGLSMSLTPSLGAPDNVLDQTGSAGLFPEDTDSGRSGLLSLSSGIAYGFATGMGILSPFAELSLHQDDSQRMRIGSRYNLDPSIDLELFGARNGYGSGDAAHSVGFSGRIRF